MFSLAVLCLTNSTVMACDHGSAKREAAALTEAVDRFSRVSSEAQAKVVDDLPCTDEPVVWPSAFAWTLSIPRHALWH